LVSLKNPKIKIIGKVEEQLIERIILAKLIRNIQGNPVLLAFVYDGSMTGKNLNDQVDPNYPGKLDAARNSCLISPSERKAIQCEWRIIGIKRAGGEAPELLR